MAPRSLLVTGQLAGRPILSSQCDDRLIALARAGSLPAFEELVARYRPQLLRYCRGFLPPERAEDAVQLTLLRAYERIDSFDGESSMRAWFYRVAHNTAIDGLRDRGYGHALIDESFDGVERPDQAAERHEEVRNAVVAIQALPARQRDAVLLREFEGRSYDEISGRLGVTPGATRQLLARARHTLRNAAAAIVPFGLVHRSPASAPPDPTVTSRLADLCNSAGASASTVVAQLGVGAVVTAGVVSGAVGVSHVMPSRHPDAAGSGAPLQARAAAPSPSSAPRAQKPASHPAPGNRSAAEAPPSTTPGLSAAPEKAAGLPPVPRLHLPKPTGGPAQPFSLVPQAFGLGSEGESTTPDPPAQGGAPPAPDHEGMPGPGPCQPQSACSPGQGTSSPDNGDSTAGQSDPTVPAPGTEGQLPTNEVQQAG